MSLKKNTAYNLFGAILPILLSLITVPIYLKTVGTERYGALQISWLLLGYFGLFDLGLGRATAFRIAAQKDDSREERAETFWSALVINSAIGMIGAIILAIAAHYFFAYYAKVDAKVLPEILTGTPLIAASLPIATLTGVLTGALQGREKFFAINVISVFSTALFQLFPLAIGLIWTIYLPWLLLAGLVARLLSLVAMWICCHRELLANAPLRISRKRCIELLRYGGWVGLGSAFAPILVITDRFAIGSLFGMTQVAIYSIPYNLASRLQIIPGALATALFPRLASAGPAEADAISEQGFRAMASVITPPVLGALLFIGPFLELWVGHDIGKASASIGRIILTAYWINAFAVVSHIRLQTSGRPDVKTINSLIQIPIYLAMLYFGMMMFGLVGCALAFALLCLLDYAMQSWSVNRRFSGAKILSMNFPILLAGHLVSTYWPVTTLWFWVGGVGLMLVSFYTSWMTLPNNIRNLVGRLPGLRSIFPQY